VFGGTFDPVHNGHLRIALDALEQLGLEQVRLIPLAHAVHRDQPETPAALRLAMLQAAVAGRDDLLADDRELRRQGPSYTVDTLESLQQDLPERSLCLLLGGDAFDAFPTWREPRRILDISNIAVLQRPGHPPLGSAGSDDLLRGRLSERLDPERRGQIVACRTTQLDISSSDIRRRIAVGRSADFLTPAPVLDLIRRHALYRH
jgi:nicotinate-nucleotide adenylyltransferase